MSERKSLILAWNPNKSYAGSYYVDVYYDQSELTRQDVENGKGTSEGHLVSYSSNNNSNVRFRDDWKSHSIKCSRNSLSVFSNSDFVEKASGGRVAVAFDGDVLTTDPSLHGKDLSHYIDLSTVDFKSGGSDKLSRCTHIMALCTTRDKGAHARFVNRDENVHVDESRKFGGSKSLGRYPLIGYYDPAFVSRDKNGKARGIALQLDVDRSCTTDKVLEFGDKKVRSCYCDIDLCKQLADVGSTYVLGNKHYISFTGNLYQKGVESEGHGNIVLLVPRDPSLAKTEKDEQFISWYNSKNQFGPSVHDSFGKTEISLHNRVRLKQETGYSSSDFQDVSLDIEVDDDFVKQ